MDKNFLLRVNDSLKNIKTQLLLDKELRTLLYYQDPDAAESVPTIEQVADHIFLQPIITVESTEPFNKQNYITITIPEGDAGNNKMDYVVRVIVMCEKNTWNYNGDIRPLLISQLVVNILDGFKTKFSNELSFSSIVETVTSKDVCGYSLLFATTDGTSDLDEK
jgi:hypothetical protein